MPSRPEGSRWLGIVAALAVLCVGPRWPGGRLGAQEAPGTPPVAGSAPEAAGSPTPAVYTRRVSVPAGPRAPAVVVAEFFTHGALESGEPRLAVRDGRGNLVPWRVLQVGPGDFCRIAFRLAPGQANYQVRYGPGVEAAGAPAWPEGPGLEFEARRWRDCDLRSLASVRAAFDVATPIGIDFVPNVYHRYNPVLADPDPFLSIYRGTLRVETPGTYAFFTTSQDCSFLLIDGKQVTAAPGRHGPVGDARFRGEAVLTPGPHRFEYVHAAAGPDTCMVAAWHPPGAGNPEPIPPEAFGSNLVARLPAVGPYDAEDRRLRDFVLAIVGEVVPEQGEPLVRVRFHSPTAGARAHWSFGDGQTGTGSEPTHVYLHPGLYEVSLSVPGDPERLSVRNRVQIGRALVAADPNTAPDTLAAYLPLLAQYDPATLDPPSALGLLRAYLEANLPERAAAAARAHLAAEPAPQGDDALHALVEIAGPLLRDRLADPQGAVDLYRAAVRVLRRPAWAAEGEVRAAEVLLDDLLQPAEAAPLLDSAAARLTIDADPAVLARLQRVRAGWHARRGEREPALAAYAQAVDLQRQASGRSVFEREARRGALGRSTEAFLRDGALDRAIDELRRWQDEFPGDMVEGTLPVQLARHELACKAFPRVLALADDLLAINPDSPFADRLVALAGESEAARGQPDRARARYQALLTDYPGSPLVEEVRQRLASLPTPATAESPAEP